MKLWDIAHSRTGDKGNISNVSLIAYDGKDYQSKSNGNSRTTNRNIDTAQTRQSITTDNRISYQRMRSIHTSQ